MTSTGNLFADVICLLPYDLECRFQNSMDDEELTGLNIGAVRGDDYTITLRIDENNRGKVLYEILLDYFHHTINHIEIYHDGKLLFEAWDGFVVGEISHTINLPDWFKESAFFVDITISNCF